MSFDQINNVTAPNNAPTNASTIEIQGEAASRAIVDVFNAAIMWQVKCGNSVQEASWQPINGGYMAPGSRRAPAEGLIFGFRFWAAVPAAQLPVGQSQAQVTVTVV